MKLPNWLPRLSRKQRVIRNLLAAAVLVFLTWGLRGFAPPTPGLALRWKAETYGLSGPGIPSALSRSSGMDGLPTPWGKRNLWNPSDR